MIFLEFVVPLPIDFMMPKQNRRQPWNRLVIEERGFHISAEDDVEQQEHGDCSQNHGVITANHQNDRTLAGDDRRPANTYREQMNDTLYVHPTDHPEELDHNAMYSNQKTFGGKQDGYKRRLTREEKQKLKCSHCGGSGHEKHECFELIGVPEWYKKYKIDRFRNKANMVEEDDTTSIKDGMSVQSSDSMHEMSKFFQAELAKYLGPFMQKAGNTTNSANLVEVTETDKQASDGYMGHYAFGTMDGINRTEWIIDSGATIHMCCYASLMHTITKLHVPQKIFLPDGSSIIADYTGEVKLSDCITLHRVLFAPAFTHNLISVGELTKDVDGKQVVGEMACSHTLMPTLTVRNWHEILGHPSVDEDDALMPEVDTSTHQNSPSLPSLEDCFAAATCSTFSPPTFPYITSPVFTPSYMTFLANVQSLQEPRSYSEASQSVGTPMKIDRNSMHGVVGHYTRVLIEIDMLLQLQSSVMIDRGDASFFVDLHYESLPLFRSECQMVGHSTSKCRNARAQGQKESSKAEAVHGSSEELSEVNKKWDAPSRNVPSTKEWVAKVFGDGGSRKEALKVDVPISNAFSALSENVDLNHAAVGDSLSGSLRGDAFDNLMKVTVFVIQHSIAPTFSREIVDPTVEEGDSGSSQRPMHTSNMGEKSHDCNSVSLENSDINSNLSEDGQVSSSLPPKCGYAKRVIPPSVELRHSGRLNPPGGAGEKSYEEESLALYVLTKANSIALHNMDLVSCQVDNNEEAEDDHLPRCSSPSP
ncbi:hypothetical protein C2S53_000591 [Perilla frutescens var. hirtella]|uniref:Retrovirus-related Pol polyprotein from transposon TNT 1-94-like beta-barrel domain-containing protein n=1 Tax=Perilla frutescens var. hirtella TaxID=608512 RepID=A0AAD4P2F0_PERFH|nr:hypothetical protein C2S53_000591 [Perilla frutescens var. hirtella]